MMSTQPALGAQTPLQPVAVYGGPENVEQTRIALCSWLVKEYKSVERALKIFDLDADGSLSAEELGRAGQQAGIAAAAIQVLIQSMGLSATGALMKIDRLVDCLEGRALASSVQDPAGAASRQSVGLHGSTGAGASVASGVNVASAATSVNASPGQRLLEASTEVLQQQKAMKTELLSLLNVSQASTFPDGRQEAAMRLLAGVHWSSVFQVRDSFGSSLLLLASRTGMDLVCKRLLSLEGLSPEDRAAYANHANEMGWTPLLLAAQNGHHSICEALLLARANVNAATSGTRLTPLMLAASNGHADTVHLLLDPKWTRPRDSRADPWQTSLDGRTALDFAQARLQVKRCLAEDHKHLPQNPVPAQSDAGLDNYGVRRPLLSEQPEPYSEIERLLLDMTHGSKFLGELRQDFLLGHEPAWKLGSKAVS